MWWGAVCALAWESCFEKQIGEISIYIFSTVYIFVVSSEWGYKDSVMYLVHHNNEVRYVSKNKRNNPHPSFSICFLASFTAASSPLSNYQTESLLIICLDTLVFELLCVLPPLHERAADSGESEGIHRVPTAVSAFCRFAGTTRKNATRRVR